MAGGRQQKAPYVVSVPFYDFSAGVNTKTPKEMLARNAMPYAKNVLWDEKNRISKVFGTTELLVVGNNAFAVNPIYNLYNYIQSTGTENLIIQAGNTATPAVMKLWVIRAPFYIKASITVTDITPSGVTLATGLRCNFATYKGKLYVLNGSSPLLRWDGNVDNPTEGWTRFHEDSFERFTYLCAFNPSHPRLFAAYSINNPTRVIYSEVNGDDFHTYYDNPLTNFYDFPTTDGEHITGLCEYQNSLLVFKPHHIYRVWGDPLYGVTITHESDGVGCVHHDTIRKMNDNLVVFMAEDGLWAYGNKQIVASSEDMKVQTSPNVVRVTSEIDNYWADNATPPNPLKFGMHAWSGATDFADFTLSDTQDLTPVSSKYPAQIVFVTDAGDAVITQSSVATGVVPLRSYVSTATPATKPYFAQLIQYDAISPYSTPVNAIPKSVQIWTTKTGTIGASHVLNCYITSTKSEGGFNVPDFTKVYAEGTVSGNTDIKDAAWTTINMTYYPTPQNLYDGNSTTPPLVAIVIQAAGDDGSNYVNWSYQTAALGATYGDTTTCMVNSDHELPVNQGLLDYGFILTCSEFANTGTVITDGFKCTDANFVRWRNVVVENIDTTFNDYSLGSKMIKVEYDFGGSGGSASWENSYTETVNGGEISGTDLWIRFRITYLRLAMAWDGQQDSFATTAIRVLWQNQATLTNLVGSAFYENRYWCAFDINDSGG